MNRQTRRLSIMFVMMLSLIFSSERLFSYNRPNSFYGMMQNNCAEQRCNACCMSRPVCYQPACYVMPMPVCGYDCYNPCLGQRCVDPCNPVVEKVDLEKFAAMLPKDKQQLEALQQYLAEALKKAADVPAQPTDKGNEQPQQNDASLPDSPDHHDALKPENKAEDNDVVKKQQPTSALPVPTPQPIPLKKRPVITMPSMPTLPTKPASVPLEADVLGNQKKK